MDLRLKTISGVKWSFVDSATNQIIQFVVAIILARLLSPKEYGLVGMLLFFLAISRSLIDSGFSQALIQKSECTQEDYCTVFFFNLIAGLSIYCTLFMLSGTIAWFYQEPILALLVKVVALNLPIEGLSIIQMSILIKNVNFKLQAKISLIAAITSGVVGIACASTGWGVWSLVIKALTQSVINTSLLWLWNGWRPQWIFDRVAFKRMYGFGSKLMLSGLINTTFNNLYYLVIGKIFSARELGFYTRAEQFKNLPSQNLTTVIQRVSFPVLSSIKDDQERLKRGYRTLIKNITFVSFNSLFALSAMSYALILVLLGERWLPLVPYLQLLCFGGMLFPLHALNLNILTVKGRSDLYLGLEVFKRVLVIPVIAMGMLWGIKMMIVGMILASIVAYFINSYWSAKMIDYSMKAQVIDVLPSFGVAAVMGTLVWLAGITLPTAPLITLLIQVVLAIVLPVVISHMIRLDVYFELRAILMDSLRSLMPSRATGQL